MNKPTLQPDNARQINVIEISEYLVEHDHHLPIVVHAITHNDTHRLIS
jgi:hypothetical protein